MKKNIKHKLELLYVYTTLLGIVICMMLTLYWLVVPVEVIEHFPDQYKLEKTTLLQGEKTFYTFDYCKHIDMNPTIRKEFIDGLVYEVPSKPMDLPLGCGRARVPLTIPKNLPPGVYKLKIQATFKVNPLRTITETNLTEEFTVVKATE